MSATNKQADPEQAAYHVLLQSRGNPDFGQDPDREISPEERVAVADFAAASAACEDYVAEHGLGGGNWTGGEVTDAGGVVVARVSYNGRVWGPDE